MSIIRKEADKAEEGISEVIYPLCAFVEKSVMVMRESGWRAAAEKRKK